MTTVVALIPAYNEAESIEETIKTLLAQSRQPDLIVVIPNGCTDKTADIAHRYSSRSLVVHELPRLEHKKPEALNIAWHTYARIADIVVCLDADTTLPPNAVADWIQEFDTRPNLGGSSSKFTMRGEDFWTRLQRSEFAKWTDTALRRKHTTVLAGTACAIRGEALRAVSQLPNRQGPWSYNSQVEDFEVTYQIRRLGYVCHVSPTVRAYTDSMKSLQALWGQRMKWQVGTIEDLLSLGVNRLTFIDWWQQTVGIFMALMRVLWLFLLVFAAGAHLLHFSWLWWIALPATFALFEGLMSLRIPHRNKWDIVYGFAIVPSEIFAMVRSAWFLTAWAQVLWSKMTGSRKDYWSLQYKAESH